MFSKSNYPVGTRNHRLVFWILCAFASFFLVNSYLLPSQSYGSTLTCVPPANLTNCEDQSTTSSDASETTDTPLVLPDISPESDDLRGGPAPAPEGNLAVNDLDLDDVTINDASESDGSDPRNLDVDQVNEEQDSGDEDNDEDNDDNDEGDGTDSGNSNSGKSKNTAPSLLPFP